MDATVMTVAAMVCSSCDVASDDLKKYPSQSCSGARALGRVRSSR